MSTTNYNPPDLLNRLATLLEERIGDRVPTLDDLATLDQFHTGGLPATVRLAAKLRIAPGSQILDVGSGLGGPARYLAATFDSYVRGVDMSEPFVEAANMLSERTSLRDRATFSVASATALPFGDETFDAAIMQHVAMNIEDRTTLYEEISRVLKHGGQFLTYDVVLQSDQPAFPVPWALAASESFLQTAAATMSLVDAAGFVREEWRVDGPDLAPTLQPVAGSPVPMLAHMLGRPDFPQALSNFATALSEGRVAILTAVLRKP